jgi:integrase
MNLQQAIDGHMEYLEDMRSPQTKDRYLQGNRQFMGYAGDVDVHDLGYNQVMGYVRWMAGQDLAKSTINTQLASVWSLYAHLLDIGEASFGVRDLELMKHRVKRRKPRGGTRRVPRIPNEDHISAIRRVAEYRAMRRSRKPKDLRNLAMLETLISTGVRPSELVAFEQGDMDIGNKTMTIWRGKGDVEGVAILSPHAWDRVMAWLRHAKTGPGFPVFQRTDNARKLGPPRAMSTNSVRYALAKLCQAAGVPIVTPKELRARFIAIVATEDTVLAMNAARHTHLGTSGKYTIMADQGVIARVRKIQKRGAL